ncbi:MAG TPA: Uma2 family endonuclease [Gemmataceae bacterium]|nr:Uma2 family endonuclease [Gemmataceae bacterium]
MAAIKELPGPLWSMAQLRRHLGMIPAERIILAPLPGTATPKDVLYLDDHHNMICELIDGVLVRKPMGFEQSVLAMFLGHQIQSFLDKHDLGIIGGEAGFVKLKAKQVRASDVAFYSWDRLPDGQLPKNGIPRLVPDLAVEILSASNTPREMKRKRRELFAKGTRLIWIIDSEAKTVEVFTSPTESTALRMGDVLDGGGVLPGFKLPLSKLFAPRRQRRK